LGNLFPFPQVALCEYEEYQFYSLSAIHHKHDLQVVLAWFLYKTRLV